MFIIGHWRTGTTLVHNLLARTPEAGFVSTYHAVFPNNLRSKWLFKTFMSIFMPKKRPGDNVKLAAGYPQEDEYALSNITYASYYHFFYFPSNYERYYREYIRFESFRNEEIEQWKRLYKTMVIKASLNVKGARVILKNPANTGRIAQLIEIFPESPFLFIMRNPVLIYLSSRKFFRELLPTVCLEEFNPEEVHDMVLDTCEKLLKDYIADRSLIAPDHLVEIKYEEFTENPLNQLQMIYNQFDLGDYSVVRTFFSDYLDTQKNYKIDQYQIKRDELDQVLEKLDFAMKQWNYDMPEDVEVI